MPEMDGYQVLAHLHADDTLRHMPVRVPCAVDAMDSIVRCMEMGAGDHLPKPFKPVLLHARVGACLEKKHLHAQQVTSLQQRHSFNEALAQRVSEAMAQRTSAAETASTTHVITGAIVGVGATTKLSAVRWGVAGRIVGAWVLTMPAAAGIAGVVWYMLYVCGVQ